MHLLAGALLAPTAVVRGTDSAHPPLRIGLSLSLSGAYANNGDMQQKAYQLWAAQVNQRGGLLGRPVELLVRDDRSTPDFARAIYEGLIERDRVDLVFSPFSSGITYAVASVADRYGYPLLAAGAASDEIWKQGYRYVFATIPPASRQTVGFLALLADSAIRTLAVVNTPDVYATALVEGTRKWATEYGIRIVSTQQLAPGTTDLEPAARIARESGASALLMAGQFEESIRMTRALKRIGWRPSAFYASVGPTLDKFGDELAGDADRVLATSTWEPRSELPFAGSADFIRQFTARFKQQPSFLAAQAYAAGQLLEEALKRVGRLDRHLLRDTLAGLDCNVIIGRYTVDQAGMLTRRPPLIIQWQGGRREIVWPPEVRTSVARLGR
ncbi:MAG TPA: amino acid ABC transporter substrate-binding protein [Aromatoleum sp.]|uniref:amino acid ABC transporter substrate-binding protein n=1 Tax=Aromatoleum sp. TaxID=2307007 RepID=UPI002B487C80|nr:amino acid ABC transporter substrate-binding protein [Aromatoleum sp.]HJV24165.1 amino acid ABC transporter substrate-binding protein [Aromatoleum sp.]